MTVGGVELCHFKGNFLTLNFEKTHYIDFRTKNNSTSYMKIVNDNELIPNVLHYAISWNKYCQYNDLENTQGTAYI
jgi:allantoicase